MSLNWILKLRGKVGEEQNFLLTVIFPPYTFLISFLSIPQFEPLSKHAFPFSSISRLSLLRTQGSSTCMLRNLAGMLQKVNYGWGYFFFYKSSCQSSGKEMVTQAFLWGDNTVQRWQNPMEQLGRWPARTPGPGLQGNLWVWSQDAWLGY